MGRRGRGRGAKGRGRGAKRRGTGGGAAGGDVAIDPATLDGVVVPDGTDALVAASGRRFDSVLRWRRDAIPGNAGGRVPWYPLATAADDGGRPSRRIGFAVGDYYLQDAGSLLALAVAGAGGEGLRGSKVLDLCAAPGGKASALVEAVGDDGWVMANEPIASRLPALRFNVARTGSTRYVVTRMDPDDLADRLPGRFDLVLVDAPCSGQSLLSRGRGGATTTRGRTIEHAAARQRRILDAAVRLTRPGGRLVYSTCTFAVAENEAQVQRLVDDGRAVPEPVAGLEAYRSGWDGSVGPATYRLWPQRDGCAGAFAARVCVVDRAASDVVGDRSRWTVEARPPEEVVRALGEAMVHREDESFDWRSRLRGGGASWWFADDGLPEGWDAVAAGGPEVAHRVGTVWRPAHAAALMRGHVRPRSVVEVDTSAAVRFWSGETLEDPKDGRSDVSGLGAGFVAVTHRGVAIGWAKRVGGRLKNHLPPAAIRR